jgi:hypothetical protein
MDVMAAIADDVDETGKRRRMNLFPELPIDMILRMYAL